MVSCSGFGLPLHAQLLRLFVTKHMRSVGWRLLCVPLVVSWADIIKRVRLQRSHLIHKDPSCTTLGTCSTPKTVNPPLLLDTLQACCRPRTHSMHAHPILFDRSMAHLELPHCSTHLSVVHRVALPTRSRPGVLPALQLWILSPAAQLQPQLQAPRCRHCPPHTPRIQTV